MVTDLQLKAFAQANPDLVMQKASKRYPDLFVVKYKNKVFYKNLWTPELREMRGLVVDRDWNVIVRPFTKIFNRLENGTDIDPYEEVVSVDKINGFLGCATWTREHGLIVSTTGSLDSDFVTLAEKWLLPYLDWFARDESNTWMFEIVDESDPHIIKEVPGLYLIGARDVAFGDLLTEDHLDAISEDAGFMRPDWRRCPFGDVLEMTASCRHEGFVVYGKDTALKIKSPFYLVKKLFSRVNVEKINDDWLDMARTWIDEEYYCLVEHIRANKESFVGLTPEERRDFIEAYINAGVSL